MDKKITINDIAAKAGVSKTTISRYLNDKFDNMSKTTKVRIEQTIAELDYRPNRQAQALKSRNSFLIGVSVADISNMYTSRLLKGIGDYFQKTHYQVLIMDADNNVDRELSNLEKMMTEQIDGIILQPLVHQPEHYQFLINKKTPVAKSIVTPNRLLGPPSCLIIFKSRLTSLKYLRQNITIQSSS